MTYIPSLNKLQLGQEATLGTPATPDIQPNGLTVRVTPKQEVVLVSAKDGTTSPPTPYITKKWSEGMISGLLDYNRAMLWLDGLFGVDDTSPHTYLSSPDWADEVPKGLTLVYGQTDMIYQVSGILPYSLKFSSSGGPWSFAYNFFGLDRVSDGANFQSLTTDTPELAGYTTTLYMDEDLDSTIGTTERDVAYSFEVTYNADHKPIWKLSNREPASYRPGKWNASRLKLVLQADTTSLDSLGDILDNTTTGKGFTTRLQTTDGTNTLKLDFCGICTSPPNIPEEVDGVVSITFDMIPADNSAYGGSCGAELTIA